MYDCSAKRESEELKPWDRFKSLPPPDDDETLDGEWLEIFIKWLKVFAYIFTFLVTLACAVLSKSLMLLMISMVKVNRTIPICNDAKYQNQISPKIDPDKKYAAIYGDEDPERIAWLWVLFFAVIAPDLFALGRSSRICYFKIYQVPSLVTFFTVSTDVKFITVFIVFISGLHYGNIQYNRNITSCVYNFANNGRDKGHNDDQCLVYCPRSAADDVKSRQNQYVEPILDFHLHSVPNSWTRRLDDGGL